MPHLDAIWIKRYHRGPMDAVENAELVSGRGLMGCANQGGRRQVTVISAQAWAEVESELGVRIDPSLRRANLLVDSLELADSRGRILQVGTCRLRVMGETRPCYRMDEAHPGLQAALGPGWRGGVFAEVLEGGSLTLGDAVFWNGFLPLETSRRPAR